MKKNVLREYLKNRELKPTEVLNNIIEEHNEAVNKMKEVQEEVTKIKRTRKPKGDK